MPTQHALIESLKDLESDLVHAGVSSCAIVYLDAQNASDDVRRVLQEIRAVNNTINYSQGVCDLRYLEGSDYRLENNSLTRETSIVTIAGKLIVPPAVKYRITSKR